MKQLWQKQWNFHPVGKGFAGTLMVTVGQAVGLGIMWSGYCTSIHIGPITIDFQWLPRKWREALKSDSLG